MEYRSLYALGKEKLAAAGIPEADLDARLLLEYVCHTSRNDLLVHGDREVAETEQQAYEQLQSVLSEVPQWSDDEELRSEMEEIAQSISRCSS